MTIKERLISLLGFAPSNDDAIEGELLDFGITGSATYTADDSVTVKKAAIKIMEILLTTADTYNETWNKIAYDRDAVMKRIKALKDELGLTDDTQPRITGKCVW